ncbi:MAG: hypothetical protein GXO07_01420 [Crenarchaeota archaeon]|nr:hypothetical protein [Thermoproteota archaeon]
MECLGRVKEIKKGKIPYTNIVTIECNGRSVEMLLHEDLITFAQGDKVKFLISEEAPQYAFGRDFCGRGVLVRDDGSKKLFSIGGFVVVAETDEKFEDGKKYYICIIKEEGP